MFELHRHKESGRTFYFDPGSGEKTWAPPPAHLLVSAFPQQDIALHWEAFRSPHHNHELFFLNSLTRQCQWARPAGFLGMPGSEPNCSPQSGSFVHYSTYYYCPLTKLCTRTVPSEVVSEEAAYEELRKQGLLWEGRDLSTSSSSSSSASSSSGEEDEEAEEAEEEEQEEQAFFRLLKQQNVTHVSRWGNWAPKLAKLPGFASLPQDKARKWFEHYVKLEVGLDSALRARLVSEARLLLETKGQANSDTQLALDKLKPSDRALLLASPPTVGKIYHSVRY
ncbi:hypothetical protein BASA81_003168 [Batrachochytrium salamandrivorans]|nr:hypothetical protein BASA81_003168 [Batrachochytrium salamandrivorans]